MQVDVNVIRSTAIRVPIPMVPGSSSNRIKFEVGLMNLLKFFCESNPTVKVRYGIDPIKSGSVLHLECDSNFGYFMLGATVNAYLESALAQYTMKS